MRTGTPTNILNPIRSAKLTTVDSFAFKYGRVEVKAKMPTGDWLWPGKLNYKHNYIIKLYNKDKIKNSAMNIFI